jgi:undecaprenyl-diphosphatase
VVAATGRAGNAVAPLLLGALLLALIAALSRRHDWAPVAALLGGFLLSVLAAQFFKQVELRPRPPGTLIHAGGYSFPSSDSALAVGSTAMAVAMARLVAPGRGRIALIAIGCALTVAAGLFFVVLRVHYLSDVIAGWALGYGAFALCAAAAFGVGDLRAATRSRSRLRRP